MIARPVKAFSASATVSTLVDQTAEWGPCLAALAAGAFDYIPCPPDHREVERILSSAISEYLQPKSLDATAS